MAYIDEFGCEYSDDKKEFVRCPENYKGHYTIQEGVTSIGEEAFYKCSGLTSITIPNSVTSIGEDAFRGCSGLTSIIVESGNTTYDSRNGCNAIIETATNTLVVGCQSTIIPNSVTSIGDGAFEGCSGLTSVTIGNSVTSIGEDAFDECDALQTIFVPLGQKARFAAMGLPASKIVESTE